MSSYEILEVILPCRFQPNSQEYAEVHWMPTNYIVEEAIKIFFWHLITTIDITRSVFHPLDYLFSLLFITCKVNFQNR